MPRANTICRNAGCPKPATYRGRCDKHAREYAAHLARTTPTHVAGRKERKQRAEYIRQWRAIHGDLCPGYKRPPHRATDLTVEHVTPVAELAPGETSAWTALCRACNSRHGAETRNKFR